MLQGFLINLSLRWRRSLVISLFNLSFRRLTVFLLLFLRLLAPLCKQAFNLIFRGVFLLLLRTLGDILDWLLLWLLCLGFGNLFVRLALVFDLIRLI